MYLYQLYIDPGTGSALFSIAIGLAAAVYFLARGLFLKLGIILFRNKNIQMRYQYVIYAEDKRYWPFFESILDEFEERKIEVHYFTSSQDDPVFSSKYDFVKGKYIGSGNKAYAFLNFLSASFVLTTTPHLDVFQWKRSKNVKHYCHMIHGAGGSLLYRLFSLDYFDSVLVPGDIEINEIRQLEKSRNLPEKQIITTGNTFFERAIKKLEQIPKEEKNRFTVLVSPSWGASALLSTFGEKLLDPLAQTEWRVIIRPHPQSVIVEKPMLDKLFEKYRDNPNIEWDYNHENIYALSKSDVMISDFSGIIYDYIFLFDKPVIVNVQNLDFRRLDAHDVDFEPYYFKAFKLIGKELTNENIGNIKEIILNLQQDTEMRKICQEVKDKMWQNRGDAGKRVVDFMIETCAESGGKGN